MVWFNRSKKKTKTTTIQIYHQPHSSHELELAKTVQIIIQAHEYVKDNFNKAGINEKHIVEVNINIINRELIHFTSVLDKHLKDYPTDNTFVIETTLNLIKLFNGEISLSDPIINQKINKIKLRINSLVRTSK